MPQIAQILETYASQIFWLLIVFGLIYITVGHGVLPKVLSTVEARDRQIAEDLAEAARARSAADEIEAAYGAKIAEARTIALKAAQDAKAKAQADAEKKVKAAEVKLDAKTGEAEAKLAVARTKALAGIEEVAVEAAQDIVAKIAGAKVAKAAAVKAVKASLANG
jgi:F-type H+-transporting ATPase subunit b